jgi:hypothetical protein
LGATDDAESDRQVVYLKTADVAARWKCSPGWLANLRSRGLGPSYTKLGSKVLYPLSAVEAYEANGRVLPVGSR